MRFSKLAEFRQERKQLKKKYKSLPDDLRQFAGVVAVEPLGTGKHFHTLTQNKIFCIIKARLFCRYLKGSSLRIVYACFAQEQHIEFIEVYYKGNKPTENKARIRSYLKINLDPVGAVPAQCGQTHF